MSLALSNEEKMWFIDFLKRVKLTEVDREALAKIFEKLRGKTFELATAILGILAAVVAYDVAKLKHKKLFPYILMFLTYQPIIDALYRYAERAGIIEKDKFVFSEFDKFLNLVEQRPETLKASEMDVIVNYERYATLREAILNYDDLAQIVQQEASNICGYEPFAQALCKYKITSTLLENIALEAYEALELKGLIKFISLIRDAMAPRIESFISIWEDEELDQIIDKFASSDEEALVVGQTVGDMLRIVYGGGLVTFEETLREEYRKTQIQVSDEALRHYNLAIENLKDAYKHIASAAKSLKIFGLVLLAIPLALGIGIFWYFVSTTPSVWKYYSQDPSLLIWHLLTAIVLGPIFINFLFLLMGAFFLGWSLKLRRPTKTIKESIEALEIMPEKFDPAKVHVIINALMTTATHPNIPSLVKSKCVVALERIKLALDNLQKFVELISES